MCGILAYVLLGQGRGKIEYPLEIAIIESVLHQQTKKLSRRGYRYHDIYN